MADNVPITPGSGEVIAADQIGGVQYQRVKVNYGTDGNATDVSASNPLPVTGSVQLTGSTGTLSIDDDGGSITVDGLVTVQDGGASLSVDDGGLTLSVDDAGGSLTVDGTVTIQDGGNVISVDDNGGSLTIDGSVTSNHGVTGLGDGRKIVASSGTRVTLASSTACKQVLISAEEDNTGAVVVGSSTCIAALATRRGIALLPGDTITLDVDDLSRVYLDAVVSGDGVTFLYTT